ncbi:MAG: hypothetical protein QMD13_04940 [Candidatus Bathyarchaeia archaeon]|nr:hypothetical protein [Candidatus Bathyarchaeia archaeon]
MEFHLYRGDFETWVAETLQDRELAEEQYPRYAEYLTELRRKASILAA